jgi:hypothetical protein
MKTQLLQDLDESGSARTGPPPAVAGSAAQPRPAGRPRPPRAEADAAAQAKGFAPQPPGFAAPIPPPDDGAEDKVPAWLAERLALDAEEQRRSERSRLWRRRLGVSGAAGVLLALLAGGGFYLYDQNRVEGALVVVANTNPAPAAVAPRPEAARASRALPAGAGPAAGASAGNAAATESGGDGSRAMGGSAGAATAAGPGPAAPASPGTASTAPPKDSEAEADADQTPDPAPPKRRRSHVTRRPTAEAAASDDEPSARQRREETLMQCRAHGYDERQCLQRGCEMTRYGFACKG